MRPNKEFKPGPSLEGTEVAPSRRVFRKGRFMESPETVEHDDDAGESFVIDLTQDQVAAVRPAEISAAGEAGVPISKYEARSLGATVKRDADAAEPVVETERPVRIEIDIAEPSEAPAPAKEWTSESSLEGNRYWRRDSRR